VSCHERHTPGSSPNALVALKVDVDKRVVVQVLSHPGTVGNDGNAHLGQMTSIDVGLAKRILFSYPDRAIPGYHLRVDIVRARHNLT
jgi:hypothetical protein